MGNKNFDILAILLASTLVGITNTWMSSHFAHIVSLRYVQNFGFTLTLLGCFSIWLLTDYFGSFTAKNWPNFFQKLVDKPNPQPDASTFHNINWYSNGHSGGAWIYLYFLGWCNCRNGDCPEDGDRKDDSDFVTVPWLVTILLMGTVLGMVPVLEIVTGVLMATLQVWWSSYGGKTS